MLQAQCSAKFFATSRFIPEIKEKFKGHKTINIRAQDEDVRSFLDRKISRSGQLLQTHHEMIKSEIAKAVDGMFLLAQLHFQFVSIKKTLKKIKDALNSLSCGPKAYDIGYQKSMDRIASQDPDSKELGMQVLSWITCAKRVLKTLELQHALAVDKNDIKLDKENIPDVDDIVSVCAGLVTVDEESGIIRLVHYTTQEYLDRTRDKWFPVAELEITMACMRYLSFDFFKGNNCTSRDEYEDPLAQIPFYKYASRNWGDHALMASMDGDHVILEFLEGICSSFRAIMTPSLDRWLHREGISYMATEVKAAAYFGLSHTILALLENGHAADRSDMGWWTPLSYAARNGHEEVVSLLISRDEVDPNSGDVISDMSPLSWAAKNGHAAVVKVLLEKEGVLADYADELDLTPLSYAAKNGHDAVVRLLLSRHDVDPNSTCWRRRTSLSLAAEKGHTAVVKLLLEKKGVLEDYGDIGGRIPLSFAAENGHEAVVRLLLAMDTLGASRMGSYSRSVPFDYASAPLYYAAVEGGHRRVVKPLMTKTRVTSDESLLGSDASEGPEKGLALFLRSSTIPDRNVEDQKTMIQGADKHGEYGSPFHLGQPSSERISLHWASENGHLALAETLLQKGAAINARRWTVSKWKYKGGPIFVEDSMTALHLAAGNGYIAMVGLLLDYGAGIDDLFIRKKASWMFESTGKEQDLFSRWEQEWGDKDIFRDRCDPDQRVFKEERTAVHLAAEGVYKAIVALLLHRGAKVYLKYKEEYSPSFS